MNLFFIGAEELENGVIKAHNDFCGLFGRMRYSGGNRCGFLDRNLK